MLYRRTRKDALVALACISVLVAGAGLALANSYYDEGYTGESLHLACDNLVLKGSGGNEAPTFEARCNTETGKTDASIFLGEGIGKTNTPIALTWDKANGHERSCYYGWEHEERSDGVYVRAKCPKGPMASGTAWTPWLNLNDGIRWKANTSKLEWR